MKPSNPRQQKGSINDPNVRFFEDYPIRSSFLKEYAEDLDKVGGWFWRGDLQMLDWLARRSFNAQGGVLELGVHLGKMFIAMNMTVESGYSYAVDVFGDLDEYNVSHSGGNIIDQKQQFVRNVEEYDTRWRGTNVNITTEDTMMLTPEQFGGNRFKIISIDAGHHREHVMNDLRLSEQLLTRNGFVIVDDWMSSEWCGVTEGTIQYLKESRGLVPFASYHHKLYMCRYNSHHKYIEAMRGLNYKRNQIQLCGHTMYNVCQNS